MTKMMMMMTVVVLMVLCFIKHLRSFTSINQSKFIFQVITEKLRTSRTSTLSERVRRVPVYLLTYTD